MNFDEFTGEIQHRLGLPGTGETVRAIRATLLSLGQRIPAGNAEDLAASLPMEIKWYPTGAVETHGQRFDWQEFVARVSDIEAVEPSEAAYHAQVIVDLVGSIVPPSDLQQLREQLPADDGWGQLFAVIDAGGWGDTQEVGAGDGPQPTGRSGAEHSGASSDHRRPQDAYDRILFPTDGSDPAESVAEYALRIASAHGATLHVLTVVDTAGGDAGTIRDDRVERLTEAGREIVDAVARRAQNAGVGVVSEVLQGDPHSSIVEYSDRSGIDCIVVPTHGRRGVERFLVGSVTERVISTASVPVIAVNPDRDRALTYPPQRVLVPTDGSRGADLALQRGIAVANATGADLHLLHVVETGALGSDEQSADPESARYQRGREVLAAATETAEEASVGTVIGVVEHGNPTKTILDYVDGNDIDLAVLGTHGRTEFNRYVLGGVSAKIVRTSPVPVMWVREPESSGSPDT
jgi:nucleotide-binding universal stress UspA family protein/uncharacterized protein (DUF2267 family)